MEREAWCCRSETQKQFKRARISATEESRNNNNNNNLKMKTQLCRRFRQGVCVLGSKCNYAHGIAELRRFQQQKPHKLCTSFFLNNHCSYGHSCRFLHSTPPSAKPNNNPPPLPQPQLGKFDCYSSAEYRKMKASTAVTIDGYYSAGRRTMQTSTAATNASTSTVAASSVHKNEPYGVKCIFKKNELQRISRIYADWI